MQIPSGMTPFNHDIKLENNVAASGSTESAQRSGASQASQQDRVTSGGGAKAAAGVQGAVQQSTAQQSASQQGQASKKEGGLQKLFAAIQKGVEQLLSLIPLLGNMLKSLLPKAAGQGGAAGAGAG